MAIFLADGEEVLRTYKCARVDFNSTDSTLQAFGMGKHRTTTDCTVTLTNKRVIYYAESSTPSSKTGMPSMHSQEAFIDRIDSLEFAQAETRSKSSFSFFLIILGVTILAMAAIAGSMMYMVPGFIVAVMGVAMFIPAFLKVKPMMLMKISTTSSGEGINVSGLSKKEQAELKFYMAPEEDFTRMSRELGALVLDLQASNGDASRIPKEE